MGGIDLSVEIAIIDQRVTLRVPVITYLHRLTVADLTTAFFEGLAR